MKVFKDSQEAGKRLGKQAIALGNFDGVHLGHQKLIRNMVSFARGQHIPAVTFTFHPHPFQVLFPEKAPKLLISPEKRTEMIGGLGVDALLMVPFNRELARLSPEYFVHEILHRQLQAQAVFVGFNYTFGHRGAGTPELLRDIGRELGFKVEVLPPIKVGGTTVSSSGVRAALEAGEVAKAKSYLGYWPIVEGRVVKGDQRGRQLGFPTANLAIESGVLIPARGVYAAKVKLGDRVFDGVVNIGFKPTFAGDPVLTVEAHILDFAQVIYGEWVTLSLIQKLRDETKFSSVEELIKQIQRDIEDAKALRNNVLYNMG
ncbi:MAG: bifunctional riboflavin kinase/FAD synthetase [Firmicutes bacterium]|nr:bifunctional riboflavin kinase/FAD synthetase [Bacillota bacterium]